MKRTLGLALGAAIAFPAAASAQETINLTVASSHPTAIPWVGMIQTHFMTETDRILAETAITRSPGRKRSAASSTMPPPR